VWPIVASQEGKEVSLDGSHSRLAVRYRKEKAERKDEAMIAKFDHRPMLTALLALTTTLLVVVVITLATLLIRATPPAATYSSESGANPVAAAAGTAEHIGMEGWNNYGHDAAPPQPAQSVIGADPNIDRHAEVVAAHHGLQ
jgi:hypothetical protein